MDAQRGFIKYFVIIVVILAVVFLSQRVLSGGAGKTIVYDLGNQAKTYAAKGSNWVMSKIYPTISEEVQKRGDTIKNEIDEQKNNISESIGKKIKNYFSGVTDSILHPGENNNCQIQSTQTPTVQ